jgi:RNA polymerase sigma-70 factor, ECF subfamily
VIELDTASDSALVVAVARCHEPALAEIYRRHGGAVHALARRVVHDPAQADEITQEVFLGLWSQPQKFDAERGTLRSYLLAQSHGKSVDAVRSDTARRHRESRVAADTATSGYDVDHEVWDLAVASQVKDALDALPVELRQPIELAYFGGNTYREVAELLDAPEGTVKGRIRSGLKELRRNLIARGIKSAGAER